MKQSIKGVGKLSRKLLTILMLSGMSTLGYAVDNSIFIDQAGDNAAITITQDGAGNTVKGLDSNGLPGIRGLDSAQIVGNNSQININQVGAGNSLALGVNTTVDSGKSTNINYSATGGYTLGLIDVNAKGQGVASNIQIDVTQSGAQSKLKADIQGVGNTLSVTTAGTGDSVDSKIRDDNTIATVNFSSSGGSNTAYLDQSGGSNQIAINTNGTNNLFNVLQSGFGNTTTVGGYDGNNISPGSPVVPTPLAGNDNTVVIAQNGDNNNANVGITGSGNVVGINQGAGGGVSNQANVKISGGGNSINISQGAGVPLMNNLPGPILVTH